MKKIQVLASLSILLLLGGCGAAFGPAGGVPGNALNFVCGSAPGRLDSPPATSSMPLPNASTIHSRADAPAPTATLPAQ